MSDFSWNVAKPTYTSKYQNTIDSLLNKISNREEFSYDFNADPLYQQYKDSYTKLGNEASMNAAANVSTLTGGYGNSYAATAASQANQQYLTKLNDVIPDLYNAALNKYKMESEDLYNQYGVYGDAEDREYGKYRDTVSDYYTERDFAYNQYRDDVTDNQWQQTFDYNKYVDDRNFNYQTSRDQVSDSQWKQNYDFNVSKNNTANDQWEKTFAYQQQRDQVADSQWEKEYQLAVQKANKSGSGSGTSTANGDFSQYSRANEASNADFEHYKEFTRIFNDQHSQEQAVNYINRRYDNDEISEQQARQLLYMIGIVTE